MCEPATLLTVAGLGAQAVGTGMRAYGEHQAGEAAGRVAESNAKLADAAAEDSIRRGGEESKDIIRYAEQLKGRQRAVYGAGGIDVASASAEDVRKGTDRLAYEDVARTQANAAREAWGFRAQADQFRAGGEAAKAAAGFNVGSTVLTGASSMLGGLGSLKVPGNRSGGLRDKYRGGKG